MLGLLEIKDRLGINRLLLFIIAVVGTIIAPTTLGFAGPAQSMPASQNATSARAAFQVATIRPSNSISSRETIGMYPGGRVTATLTVKSLIERAYGIRDFQIVGAPKWLESAKYDIVAKSDETQDPSRLSPSDQDAYIERQKQRLQSLLADRFQLKFHYENKELPVFALVLAKNGPKLQPPKQGEPHRLYTSGPGHLACFGASMPELAAELTEIGVGRIVLDKTGLTGRYDFKLQWSPEDWGSVDSPLPDSSGGSLFTALVEQAGLKLQSQRGPVQTFVIDRVERPSAN